VIRVDIAATQKALNNLSKQLPFAVSLGLNRLANAGQKAQRDHTRQAFVLRREKFILDTIKRMPGEDFATKQKLSAGYRIDPSRDYLAKHEHTHEKHAIQGKPYVAVPLPDLRRNKKGLVPKSLMPSAFKPWTDSGSVAEGAKRTFIVPTKSGNRVLLQRFGGTRGKHGVRALYLFVPSVHIDARLQFEQTARAVAQSQWPRIFADAWAQALRTAK
jgi:hypothetical protein